MTKEQTCPAPLFRPTWGFLLSLSNSTACPYKVLRLCSNLSLPTYAFERVCGAKGRAKRNMDTRDYSAKELQDDVPAIAYDTVNIPNYKFVDFDESNEFTESCLKLDGCMGFSQHDWDCPKFRDYSSATVF